MDVPGISLFQGSDCIRLNNSNQREEEEFIAEENERKAELKKIFKNAFDDLVDEDDDDDDSTPDSSQCSSSRMHLHHHSGSFDSGSDKSYSISGQNYNEPTHEEIVHAKHLEYNTHIPNYVHQNGDVYNGSGGQTYESSQNQNERDSHLAAYKQADFNSIEQLKLLYDVRMRDIERLKKELDAERNGREQILRKLSICETEKSGILSNNKQLSETLALSNEKIKELEGELCALKEDINKVAKERDQCKNEGAILKMQILNLEQQIVVMQRCDGLGDKEKQYDAMIETLKRKHKEEIHCLEQQCETALRKIEEKEVTQHHLEQKIEEIERRHVATLLNKCDSTVRQEATVKALLDQANAEKLDLTKKMNALEAECKMLRNDLEQYESASRLRLFDTNSVEESDTDSVIQLRLNKKDNLKKSNSISSNTQQVQNHYAEDLIEKLKDELHRAIIGQRSKRNEIKKLQEQIQLKELQINKVKEQEKSSLMEMDNLNKELANTKELLKNAIENSIENKYTEKINSLETELYTVKSEKRNNMQKLTDLEKEIKSLQEKLMKEEFNKKRQAEEYVEFHDNEIAKIRNDHQLVLQEKEMELSKKIEDILNENDEVKQLYIEIRTSKDKLLKTLEEESLKCNSYMIERDEYKVIVEKLKEDISCLENNILQLNEDKKELENEIKNRKESYNSKAAQEVGLDKIQSDVFVMANGHQINLQEMREEVALAKKKYVDLERNLKLEYEERLLKLQLDNSKLKEDLKIKEEEVSLLYRKVHNEKNNVATITEEEIKTDGSIINEKHIEEINKLVAEVEKLRARELKTNQDTLQLELEYQQKLQYELEELESKLRARHKEELAESEERIKTYSVQYYTVEIGKLQESHKAEIQNLMKQNLLKNEEIKNVLIRKEIEVHQMVDLKKQLLGLQASSELERKASSDKLTQLVKELDNMKSKLELNGKEIDELNAKLLKARKKINSYKAALKKANTIIPENYAAVMDEIKLRSEAIAFKETLVENNLKAIEQEMKILRKIQK